MFNVSKLHNKLPAPHETSPTLNTMSKNSLPSLACLQSFEAAARLGSFTKAAAERHLTHSAISRHIQALEHCCAESLFERNGPRVLLSEAGHRLQQRLSEPLLALHAALNMKAMPAGQQKLKVLLLTSLACTWLMPRLPAFARELPHIQLSLETGYEMVSLPPQQATVALRFGHFARAGLRCQRLWFDQMVAVAAPSWVQQYGLDAERWPSTQLLRHSYEPWPLRLPTGETGAANKGSKLAAAEGFEFNDALLLVQAALLACGVAWVRSSMVQGLVDQGQLQVLAQSEQVSDKSAWLVCREDTADLPAVRDFFKWAMAQARANDKTERSSTVPPT